MDDLNNRGTPEAISDRPDQHTIVELREELQGKLSSERRLEIQEVLAANGFPIDRKLTF